MPRRLAARLASSLCSFPAAQKFFVLKRVLLTLERMSLPLKSLDMSLGATYQVSVLARRAEIILTVTTLLGKTKNERHPSLLAAPVPTVYQNPSQHSTVRSHSQSARIEKSEMDTRLLPSLS